MNQTVGVFRRKGVVRATRLSGPRTWTHDGDNPLVAQAGDWWVISPNGQERGVAASEFDRLYEPCGDGTYRARGMVRARQALTAESVTTLEGVQTARPGDWIVDDGHNRWPVPDEHFRNVYQAVDEP